VDSQFINVLLIIFLCINFLAMPTFGLGHVVFACTVSKDTPHSVSIFVFFVNHYDGSLSILCR